MVVTALRSVDGFAGRAGEIIAEPRHLLAVLDEGIDDDPGSVAV